METLDIIEEIRTNDYFCEELNFLFPHICNIIKIYKGNPYNSVIKEKLIHDINGIKENGKFIELFESKMINNIDPIDVRGKVYKINATPNDYKKFIDHARKNNWRYNSFSVVERKDKWIIFFR